MDVLWCGLLLLLFLGVSAEECGLCDCHLSESSVAEGGVRTIQTRCREGQVSWKSPKGAVRVQVKAPFSGDFKLCFIVESKFLKVVVSREVNVEMSASRRRKSKRRVLDDTDLEQLVIGDRRTGEYCMTSSTTVVLYIESVASSTAAGIGTFTLQYDIEKVTKSVKYTPLEECRPCTDEELIRSYCSSDFVVLGTMGDVIHTDEHTEIVVEASQVIRQRGSHFHRTTRQSKTVSGVILAPRQCGIALGRGDFLFTGRLRLGQLSLRCAPYLEEWQSLVHRAQIDGRMECEVE